MTGEISTVVFIVKNFTVKSWGNLAEQRVRVRVFTIQNGVLRMILEWYFESLKLADLMVLYINYYYSYMVSSNEI